MVSEEMAAPSSSQEIELEYTIWEVPASAPVAILRRVQEGIHREVSEAFAAAPHLGPETGGILLGRREAHRLVVEDFEPVPSEHRFGPSYRLSDADREMLRETLEWFRSGAQPGLSVLGFYRSHTLPDFALGPEDEDLMRAHFREGEDLVLQVKPNLMGSKAEDFFLCRCVQAAAAPPDSPVVTWPPPRARLVPEPERPAGKRWPWYLAAMALGLAGGALGYLWWTPQAGEARPAATSAGPPAAIPSQPWPAASPAQPAVEAAPVPPAPDMAGIQALLDRWASALKRGDVNAAGECYAPVVTTYFSRHDVTRAAVRKSMQQARARYGRLEVYRISGVAITPVGENRAVATFRKHWRTSGRTRSAGSEAERITLVRNQGAWQISSEQAESGFRSAP